MEYTLGKAPMVGTVSKGSITLVEEGILKQFLEDTTKWGDPDSKCLQVTIKSDTEKTFSRILTLSVDSQGVIYPSSNLGKFFARYGGFPKVGMDVSLVVNAKGWFDLIL